MVVDFSLLKNIDFTNPENLLFLFIFLVVVIIIFSVFIVIVKTLIRLIAKIFGLDVKKPKFDKKENAGLLHQEKEAKKKLSAIIF
jgi:hypothetical protein